MSAGVFLWWSVLCAVSALNIFAWAFSVLALERRRSFLCDRDYRLRRLQIFLSAGYVFGCAFRSALPVYDIPRLCLFDIWLSSAIVGRSVATIAELCFVTQWALLLREMSCATESNLGKSVSILLVPLIVVAETCSTYSVLTTSNLGHVAEESIWGLCALLAVLSMIAILPRCAVALRAPLIALCVAGTAYVSYMFLVDVPMYWARWVADEASGRHYLSIAQGLADAAGRRVVSHRWEDWKSEVVWMSMYFSVAVWLSIAFIHAPVPERRTVSGRRGRLSAGSERRSGTQLFESA